MAKSKKTDEKLSDRKGEKKYRAKWDKKKAKNAEDARSADTDDQFSNAAGAGRVRSGAEDTDHDPQGYNEGTKKKKGKGKKDMITLNLDGKKHNCKKVHPDQTHKAWEKKNVKEEAMGAAEYRKKGIYVTDQNHPGKGGKEDPDDRRTKQGAHPPRSEGGGQSGHQGIGRNKIKPKKGGHQQDPGEQGTYGESNQIIGFIKNMTEKNYAQANKYLQAALNEKMRTKIRKTADDLGF